MTRDTRLTLWPEQVAFFPLANSWGAIKNTKTLDFSYCLEISSCGLAASSLILNWLFNKGLSRKNIISKSSPAEKANQLSLFSLAGIPEDKFSAPSGRLEKQQKLIETVFENKSVNIMEACQSLGFFESIDDFLSTSIKLKYNVGSKNINPIKTSATETSYPIFKLRRENYGTHKREMVDDFLNYSYPIFDSFFRKKPDKGNQLNHILEEIIKNIADHAHADGVVGIDISEKDEQPTLSILIGDAGPGIYTHMRENYILFKQHRGSYTGIAEVYHHALANGVSGVEGPDNYGYGMSTIINNSIAIGARLSVFDESTRLVLTSLSPIIHTHGEAGPSHNEIWRVSFRFDGRKPFFYFLQCGD